MPGGGGGPTTSTVNQSSLPAYARPYYEALMERGAKESTTKYQPYKGDRLAGQSDATKTGLGMAGQYAQSGTPLLDQAAGIQQGVAGKAGQLANYQSGNITNAYTGPKQGNYVGSNYASQQLGFGQGGINPVTGQTVSAQQQGFGQNGVNQVGFGQGGYNQVGFGQNGLSQLGYGGDIEKVMSNNFNAQSAQQYMSPYMDAVTNKAQADALENAANAQSQRNLQAARSGSFGGSRAAVQNQMANNATQSNLTDIMVKGQQSAFENAQSQFNTDQSRALQAAIQNQNTGLSMGQNNQNAALSVGQQNQNSALQALLANQQAGLTMGGQNQDANLRAMLANQSTNLTSQQLNQATGLAMGQSNQNASLDAAKLNEQSKQYGYGASEQAWQQAGQMGLDAQKANEQFRQSGAALGLQGLDMQSKAGMNLNALQSSRDDAMLNRIKAQLGMGQTQEDYRQQSLDQSYNDFVNQRDSERQNLQFLSSLLQGVPVSANQDVTTQASQNNLQGVLGAAGGLQALYGLGGK